jgi:type 1 glutamine amidotransferase
MLQRMGRLAVVMGAVVALGAVCSRAVAAEPGEAKAPAGKTRKVLYLTHSQGFNHPVLGLSEKLLPEMGKKSGAFEVTCLQGYKQKPDKIDLSMITPEYLKQFDAIIFYTTGELPLKPEQKKAIVDFVRGGKGIVGIHSATDFSKKPDYWPAFKEMFGAIFKTHGANDAPLILKIEDPTHPATKMLPAEWKIADEMYQFAEPVPRDKFHILISVDTEKSDPANLAKNKMEKGKVYDVAWCRTFGKGRVFYTSLGHREDVWENKLYQEHLVAGIKWAMGEGPADATPSAAKPGRARTGRNQKKANTPAAGQ